MKTEKLTFLIDRERDIVFKSEYANVEERAGALYCSLKGEFFEKDQRYNPPLEYELNEVGVTTREFIKILIPIYHFLRLERSIK